MKKSFKTLLKKCKSNKGFTFEDIVVAIVILVMFAATIGASYVSVYKVQAETKLSSLATIYGIKIFENIDKINYDDVPTSTETDKIAQLESKYRTDYNIPDAVVIDLNITQYNDADTIKKVTLTVSYEYSGDTENLVLEKLKVREI